jgi:hypothetical protein
MKQKFVKHIIEVKYCGHTFWAHIHIDHGNGYSYTGKKGERDEYLGALYNRHGERIYQYLIISMFNSKSARQEIIDIAYKIALGQCYEGTSAAQNNTRVARISKVLKVYGDEFDHATGVSDLVADLYHYCAANNIDFDTLADIGRRNYLAECTGKRKFLDHHGNSGSSMNTGNCM